VDSSRRSLFKKGLLGGVLLAAGSGAAVALRGTRLGKPPRRKLALLSPEEYAVFAAVAARVVPGDGAGPDWPSAEAVDCAGKCDELLARVHPEVGAEFRQLLRLFENGLGGLFLSFSPAPFTTLSAAGQDARLLTWRHSRLSLLRSGYLALVRLAHATYYSSPEVYARIGYPGPPEVPG
jgi:hypothetical protein